jgi:hypothetical protein
MEVGYITNNPFPVSITPAFCCGSRPTRVFGIGSHRDWEAIHLLCEAVLLFPDCYILTNKKGELKKIGFSQRIQK